MGARTMVSMVMFIVLRIENRKFLKSYQTLP